MKTVLNIRIDGDRAIVHYLNDEIGPGGREPSRRIRKQVKVLPLEDLIHQGGLNLYRLAEIL